MKRQVWLNIESGEFSDSWEVDENGNSIEFKTLTLEKLKEPAVDRKWKLIEYICHTDESFEFCNLMKLR